MVADSGIINSYLNGVLIDTTTPTDDIIFSYIGNYSGLDRGRNGDIGRIVIYDNPITEKERAKLYSEFLHTSPITKTIR